MAQLVVHFMADPLAGLTEMRRVTRPGGAVVACVWEAFSELNDAAKRHSATIHWISLGQLGTCIRLLREAGATRAVMAGQVKHTKIFGGIIPDQDIDALKKLGVAAIFQPGTAMDDIVKFIRANVKGAGVAS